MTYIDLYRCAFWLFMAWRELQILHNIDALWKTSQDLWVSIQYSILNFLTMQELLIWETYKLQATYFHYTDIIAPWTMIKKSFTPVWR